MSTIAIIGGGKIGEALVSGLLAAGHDAESIVVTNRQNARRKYMQDVYGVKVSEDNVWAADGADVVFVCVKPAQVLRVVEELSEAIDNNDSTVLVSLAAGISLGVMEQAATAGTPIVRVMPNTPMLVGRGMSPMAAGRYANEEHVARVTVLLKAVGEVVIVEESQMDAVTAVSGSGPAYYMLLAEALIDAGVHLGLTREVSTLIAKQVAAGAGELLGEEGANPVDLRAAITSPAGTTAAAVRQLEESGVRGAVYRAAEASYRRSAELGG